MNELSPEETHSVLQRRQKPGSVIPGCDSHRWPSALLPREHGFHLSLQGVCFLGKKRRACEMAALKGRVGGQESTVASLAQKWVAAVNTERGALKCQCSSHGRV